jgi:hypothetical protein
MCENSKLTTSKLSRAITSRSRAVNAGLTWVNHSKLRREASERSCSARLRPTGSPKASLGTVTTCLQYSLVARIDSAWAWVSAVLSSDTTESSWRRARSVIRPCSRRAPPNCGGLGR